MITLNAGKQILTRQELKMVLECIDDSFEPPLSERIIVDDYAEKIYTNASLIVANDNLNLAGLCAFYDNNQESKNAFLTLIYIFDSYRGEGLGTKLLTEMIFKLKLAGFKEISLEVQRANIQAITMYHNLGFIISSPKSSSNIMTLAL